MVINHFLFKLKRSIIEVTNVPELNESIKIQEEMNDRMM